VEVASQFNGKISHLFKGIDVAGFGRAGDADDAQWTNTLITQALTVLTKAPHVDAIVLISFNRNQVLTSNPKQISRFPQRVVCSSRSQYRQAGTAEVLQRFGKAFLSNTFKVARG